MGYPRHPTATAIDVGRPRNSSFANEEGIAFFEGWWLATGSTPPAAQRNPAPISPPAVHTFRGHSRDVVDLPC